MTKHVERKVAEYSFPDISVIGTGEVGEKARQLIDKTPILKALGFRTPHRTILAEGFLDDFFKANMLGENLRDASARGIAEDGIRDGSLTSQQIEILQKIGSSYGNTPLIIRSSAAGDARGTGTYKSIFSDNQPKKIERAIREVLASYFSPSAYVFRRDANTGECLGIMIEPIVAHIFGEMLAPVLSGFGYTSTSHGKGYITVVPGLGCAVESRAGERITEEQITKSNTSLGGFIYQETRAMSSGLKTWRWSSLLKIDGNPAYNIKAFRNPNEVQQTGRVVDTSISFPENISQVFNNLKLAPFFSTMKQMEQSFGKPQYFEWAMTVEENKPVFWIIQIADVDKKIDLIDFGDFEKNKIITGNTVTGTGVKKVSQIVLCYNEGDLDLLDKFNPEHKDYCLIISSRLSTRGNTKYISFSNASAIIEIADIRHNNEPIAHFEGQLDMTGKFFAVLSYDEETQPDQCLSVEKGENIGGLIVFNGKYVVVASERQNRLMICLED